jgi:hypothetical protein
MNIENVIYIHPHQFSTEQNNIAKAISEGTHP